MKDLKARVGGKEWPREKIPSVKISEEPFLEIPTKSRMRS
jgi:hypothetical protein